MYVCSQCVDMRVIVGPRDVEVYNRGTLRHDDVLIVSDFFCREDDWDIYYRLIDEMRQSQAQGTKNADWIRFSAASGEHRFCSLLENRCFLVGTRART